MTKQTKQDHQDIQHLRIFWVPQAARDVTRAKNAYKAARAELKKYRDRLKKLRARVRVAEHG